MRVERSLLIFPPNVNYRTVANCCCPPLGLAYLAASIRDRVEVKILDAVAEGWSHVERVSDKLVSYGLSFDEISRRIEEYRPDLIGVSCLFSCQWLGVREILRRAKAINRDVVTVIGGTHPSFLSEDCLRDEPALDYIIIGEGETSFPALIEALRRETGLDDIDGLARRDNGKVVVQPKTKWITDIDSLPFPARDLLPMEKYFEINVPMLLNHRAERSTSIISSRGCPYNCSYCSSTRFWGGKYRPRNPEKVLDEIEELKTKYGVQELKFEDDNLTADKKRAKTIFQGMIDRGLAMPWNTPNGISIWTLDDQMLTLMKKSGCFEIVLAVESGDQWVLENIANKPLRLDIVREVARKANRLGIFTVGYFIVGFPGETKEQIERTFKFARALKLDKVYPFIYNPLPGTPLYWKLKDEGKLPLNVVNGENYFSASLPGVDWTPEWLEKMQKREFWYNSFAPFFRNPVRFFNRYSYLLKEPRYFKHTLNAVASELFGRRDETQNKPACKAGCSQ